MHELLFMAAEIIPEQFLVKELKTHLTKYEETPNDDSRGRLEASMMLLLAKLAQEGKKKHAEKVSKVGNAFEDLEKSESKV